MREQGLVHRAPWREAVRLVSVEHGAFLWLPALLVAVAVTLFAMRVAPTGLSLFTRTTSLRIALGPCMPAGAEATECAAFVATLRRELAASGELTLVDSLKVRARVAALADPASELEPAALLRAVRPLNPHLLLWLELGRDPEPAFRARVEAWDVHAPRRLLVIEARASGPVPLGRAVADSLERALLEPGSALAALESSPAASRSSIAVP